MSDPFFTINEISLGRLGKKVIPVILSTCEILFTYKSFLLFPSVFLQMNPIPFGVPLRHMITLKNASGIMILFAPIV